MPPFGLVQATAQQFQQSSAPRSLTLPGTAAGNLLCLNVSGFSSGAPVLSLPAGWQRLVRQTAGNGVAEIWALLAGPGGDVAVTVTPDRSSYLSLALAEHDAQGVTAVVGAAVSAAGSGTAVGSGSLTAGAGDLVVGAMTHTSATTTLSEGAGWARVASLPTNVSYQPLAAEYQVAAGGALAATWTAGASVAWAAAAATITTGGGGGGTLSLTEPVPYQTVQRNAVGQSALNIAGTYTGTPAAIEASFNGGAYQTIDAAPAGGSFSGTLTGCPSGSGTLTVRFTDQPAVQAQVGNVRIGRVILTVGDSICDGRLAAAQSYSPASGLAAVYENGANVWKNGDDLTSTGIASAGAGGSLWPLLLTQLLAEAPGVPCAVVPYGFGGTPLSAWISQGFYAGSLGQLRAAGTNGCEAVVVVLGTNDASSAADEATVSAQYQAVADKYRADLGVPAVLFQTVVGGSGGDSVRLAAGDACAADANCLGPAWLGDQTNVGHFTSGGSPDALGQEMAGRLWAALKGHRGPRLVSATYSPDQTKITLAFDTPAVDPGLFGVMGGGTAVAVASAALAVTLTLASAAALPILVSYGLGGSTAGRAFPPGTIVPLPGGGGVSLPPEPFGGVQATGA